MLQAVQCAKGVTAPSYCGYNDRSKQRCVLGKEGVRCASTTRQLRSSTCQAKHAPSAGDRLPGAKSGSGCGTKWCIAAMRAAQNGT
jgi:hypothetical protein